MKKQILSLILVTTLGHLFAAEPAAKFELPQDALVNKINPVPDMEMYKTKIPVGTLIAGKSPRGNFLSMIKFADRSLTAEQKVALNAPYQDGEYIFDHLKARFDQQQEAERKNKFSF